jgi:hypothetical protein
LTCSTIGAEGPGGVIAVGPVAGMLRDATP